MPGLARGPISEEFQAVEAELHFLPGVAAEHVLTRLRAAGGKEVESGKLSSPESSAALAVNTFGWFIDRPAELPPFPGMGNVGQPTMIDVEYCARFPWSGGRHPWLDAVVETGTHLIGVEAKRYEPFRDRKTVSLSAAYDRPVWGTAMWPFERMRDRLRSGEISFTYLDAAQLVKHAFGLVTDARRRSRKPALLYLYAEPERLNGKPIPTSAFGAHRAEVERFGDEVSGAEVSFTSTGYRDWLREWPESMPDLAEHARAILNRFQP